MHTPVVVFILCGLLAQAGSATEKLPDLDLTHIERTPKYNPIPWVFPDKGPQFHGDPKRRHPFTAEQLKKMKERPAPGDAVQFIAHVVNAADVAAPLFTAEWRVDGKVVRKLEGKQLGPWEATTFALPWRWADGAHIIEFVVDPENRIAEACKHNNRIADRTDAVSLQMRVTRQLYDAFRRKANRLGSRSFEDWVQQHIGIMNRTFAACVYQKTCPKGILERVRVDDFILMTKEEMGQRLPQSMGCDGGWNFYDDNFPAWFDSHIGLDFHTSIDWGLIHEWTHQLGIIDLYTIVVAAHWNHVRDPEGQPVWIGWPGCQPCIMSGSGARVSPDGSTLSPLTLKVDVDGRVMAGEKLAFMAYSEHTAGGLNTLLGKRRGHFGLYLFDIPRENSVQVLDNAGQPVAGAHVAVHQQTPEPGPQSIAAKPTINGKTDTEGLLSLGSRPFGDINTIGLNGTLFFVIQARGHTEYRFLDITQFNIAKWQGQEKFTAKLRTGIPQEITPPPVRNLRCALWPPNKPVTLAWEPPAGGDVKEYRVYRVFAPQYHSVSFQPRYEKVATLPAGTTRAEVQPPPGYAGVTDVRCFMVTAVDAQGRESGYADDRQLARFAFPTGGAKIERTGERGKTARVTLGPQAFLHLRESALVEKRTTLKFRFRTRSRTPVSLRMAVAGLGQVQVALTGPPAAGVPVLGEFKGLNDGTWKEVRLDLRDWIDAVAKEKKVTPTQARTTWNDDWLITELRFGHFSPAAPAQPESYEFEDLEFADKL